MVRLTGIIWKRTDFRESSRVLSIWTRDRGRVHALGKGAHRPKSTLLGKVDFLNRVEVDLSGGSGLPILTRARLLHEPRALREPARFLSANYLADLFDRVLAAGQIDPHAYDLCDGGLVLFERADLASLPIVLIGMELRLLAYLGTLPDLLACSQCGQAFARERPPRIHQDVGGVYCPIHAPRGSTSLPKGTLQAVEAIRAASGREWATLPRPVAFGSAVGLVARWLGMALEDIPKSRRQALSFLARQKQPSRSQLPSQA